MRIRLPFAGETPPTVLHLQHQAFPSPTPYKAELTTSPGAFVCLLVLAGYAGLSSLQLNGVINDKALHFLTFFLLTICFYWVLDSSRNRNLKFTLVVCTAILGVGSEFVQGLIPDNGREFDLYDIVANVLGSGCALALNSWYHKRMIERKRKRKGYTGVPTTEGAEDHNLELGEGVNGQESGIVHHDTAPAAVSLEQELDNWDENAEDAWDEDDNAAATTDGFAPSGSATVAATEPEDIKDAKKRAD